MDSHIEIQSVLAESRRLQDTNPARALELALQVQAQASHPEEQAACLLVCGVSRINLADFNGAMADLSGALERYQRLGDTAGVAAALDELGNCWGEQGENVRALAYHLQSLALWQTLNNLEGLSRCLNRLGIRYYYFGQYDTALEYYQQSLALREAVGDRVGIANSYDNLAIIYDKFGDYERAAEYYQRSVSLFEELDSPYHLANALKNMGEMLDECLHQPEQARAAMLRALDLVRGSNRLFESLCYQSLGNLERGLGHHAQAQAHYQAGIALMREIGTHEQHLPEILVDLGRSQLASSDLPGALANLRQALELASLGQANETIFLAHQWLAEACEQAGDTQAALGHFKEFHRVREEVYSTRTELKVKSLLLKAETDKANQEAQIARQEAEIYRLKHEELQAALEQNEHLLEELQLKTEDLLYQVWEDALTGIHNRRYLEMRLPEECERTRRFGHDLALALMDIDDFKQINDRLSHMTGDEVLKALAQILVSISRSVDLVVRYGGDEFLLVMIETDPRQALQVCERLREAVAQYDWSSISAGISITLSIGLCSLLSLPEEADLMACADQRLYEAKRAGKNRIVGE